MIVLFSIILALTSLPAHGNMPLRALPAPWVHWKYVRVVNAQITAPATLAITVPPSIYANAQASLDDLRVIDDRGDAVPFAIETPPPQGLQTWKDTILTDTGFVPGQYSQAVADLGPTRITYNALEIDTPLEAFATHVVVDASDDGTTWRTIRTNAPIYDYRQDGLATNARVIFPASTARYLRIRVLEPTHTFPISGIQVSEANTRQPESTHYPLSIRVNQTLQETVAIIDGLNEVPIRRFRIDASTPRFVRAVDIQTSTDGKTWETQLSPNISRTAPGNDNASITFDELQAPYWRIIIHNGDDAPLVNLRLEAYGAPRRLYFDAVPNAAYSIVYGNPYTQAPVFDYSQTHAATTLSQTTPTAVGPPIENPGFISATPTTPWSERHPWILWLALAAAVAIIGMLAIRTMSSEKPTQSHDR